MIEEAQITSKRIGYGNEFSFLIEESQGIKIQVIQLNQVSAAIVGLPCLIRGDEGIKAGVQYQSLFCS